MSTIPVNLTREEIQANLELLHIAIKAVGLSPQAENAIVLGRKFSAAMEVPKPDLEATAFAQANTE